MSALSPGNAALNTGLTAAMGVLHRLDEMGLTAKSIDVRGGRPVVQIEPPPIHSFVRGAMRRRERRGNALHTVIAAPFHGVQIEWDAVRPIGEPEPA